jgi:hypothetical protein
MLRVQALLVMEYASTADTARSSQARCRVTPSKWVILIVVQSSAEEERDTDRGQMERGGRV